MTTIFKGWSPPRHSFRKVAANIANCFQQITTTLHNSNHIEKIDIAATLQIKRYPRVHYTIGTKNASGVSLTLSLLKAISGHTPWVSVLVAIFQARGSCSASVSLSKT